VTRVLEQRPCADGGVDLEPRTWLEEEGVSDLDDAGVRPQLCHEDAGVLHVVLAAQP
jgi:hypothetical protein